MKMTCVTFAFKYLTSCTFLGKIGKYIKPCVGEGLCGTFVIQFSCSIRYPLLLTEQRQHDMTVEACLTPLHMAAAWLEHQSPIQVLTRLGVA